MKIILPAVLLSALAAAPVSAQPAARPATGTQVMQPAKMLAAPSNFDLLQAINNLSQQVSQLQSELASVQGKLDAAKQQANDDYQRTNYRVLQTCEVAYLRSFKAGDNPSSGQGGNPFLPEGWCDIGSYPYWKSVK
ncbi:MAG TPA: hypothetical protein VLT91_00875 [Rhizomicrobium sp.]|nr:hypothetical protein [Rhizomicrobium sp.]